MRLAPRSIAVLLLLLAFPTPALAHGEQLIMAIAMFPWIIVSIAFLFWRVSATGQVRASWSTTTAVLGTSAALLLANVTFCLTWWWCSDAAWWLFILAQFAVPISVWCGLWWRSRRKVAADS
jgi:hypothetical protein